MSNKSLAKKMRIPFDMKTNISIIALDVSESKKKLSLLVKNLQPAIGCCSIETVRLFASMEGVYHADH